MGISIFFQHFDWTLFDEVLPFEYFIKRYYTCNSSGQECVIFKLQDEVVFTSYLWIFIKVFTVFFIKYSYFVHWTLKNNNILLNWTLGLLVNYWYGISGGVFNSWFAFKIYHTATIISMKFIENCFDMDVFIILLVIICFKFSGSTGSFLVLHSTIYKFVPAFSIE